MEIIYSDHENNLQIDSKSQMPNGERWTNGHVINDVKVRSISYSFIKIIRCYTKIEQVKNRIRSLGDYTRKFHFKMKKMSLKKFLGQKISLKKYQNDLNQEMIQ